MLHDAAEEHYPVDKVVFGVAAALVVAFLIWGVASTDTLSAVATAVLSGVITGGGVFGEPFFFSASTAASRSAATTRSRSSGPCRGSR